MSGLSELSSALPHRLPAYVLQHSMPSSDPFPGNVAVGLTARIRQSGESESAWQRGLLSYAQLFSQSQGEGMVTGVLASSGVPRKAGARRLEASIGELKTEYVFRNESAI